MSRADKHVPVRTCVGCNRKAPQKELFKYKDKRSIYLCINSPACFEKALQRKAFSRALRREVNPLEIERIRKEHQKSG